MAATEAFKCHSILLVLVFDSCSKHRLVANSYFSSHALSIGGMLGNPSTLRSLYLTE